MKGFKGNWTVLAGVLAGSLLAATADIGWVSAQTAPALSITTLGTNQVSITITNGLSTGSYELWWTPNLGDTADFPWTTAVVGNVGQTNFLLPYWNYPAVFFRGVLDAAAVPLWEAADPNNPASPILTVTIASPKNGSVLQ